MVPYHQMGTSETGPILLLVSISTVSRKESCLLLFKIIVPDYEVIRPFKFSIFLLGKDIGVCASLTSIFQQYSSQLNLLPSLWTKGFVFFSQSANCFRYKV
jgi:hypothetical protein